MGEEPEGKRVSWVELYFDLIFAFAVGETTHVMVATPDWSGFARLKVIKADPLTYFHSAPPD